MGNSNRNRRIDILRAITIILIVMYHEGSFPPSLFWTSKFFPLGTYIICLFFFVSGYLFKPFEIKETGKFVLNHCHTRILPFQIPASCRRYFHSQPIIDNPVYKRSSIHSKPCHLVCRHALSCYNHLWDTQYSWAQIHS